MVTFFPSCRTDVQREMARLRNEGYLFNPNKYLLIDKILINDLKGSEYIEVKVNNSDVRFYLTVFGTTMYLSIEDIYKCLIENDNKSLLTRVLQSKRTKEVKFIYRDVNYKFHHFSDEIIDAIDGIKVYLEKIDGEIYLSDLLILLSLIQDKSDYLFRKDEKYQSGIYRLIYALLFKKKSTILIEKGWIFNGESYDLDKSKANSSKHSYYLTKTELTDIIKLP